MTNIRWRALPESTPWEDRDGGLRLMATAGETAWIVSDTWVDLAEMS